MSVKKPKQSSSHNGNTEVVAAEPEVKYEPSSHGDRKKYRRSVSVVIEGVVPDPLGDGELDPRITIDCLQAEISVRKTDAPEGGGEMLVLGVEPFAGDRRRDERRREMQTWYRKQPSSK